MSSSIGRDNGIADQGANQIPNPSAELSQSRRDQNQAAVPVIDNQFNRIKDSPMKDWSAQEAFTYLAYETPQFIKFELSWCLSGAQLLNFHPSTFIQNIQQEIPMIPFSICISLFVSIQRKIANDFLVSTGEFQLIRPDIGLAWSLAKVPASVIPPSTFSGFSETLPMRSPLQPTQLQSLYSPIMPAIKTGNQRTKFAFGGPRAMSSPDMQQSMVSTLLQYPALSQALANQSVFPISANVFGQLPTSLHSNQSAIQALNIPSLRQPSAVQAAHSEQIASSAVNAARAPGQSAVSAAQVPFPNFASSAVNTAQAGGQSAVNAAQGSNHFDAWSAVHSAPILGHIHRNSQAEASAIYSPFNQNPQSSADAALLSNPLVHQLMTVLPQLTGARAKPELPWEKAAKIRAIASPFVQDERLPIGYKRITMDTIVAQAKANRARDPNKNTSKIVRWPKMLVFNKKEYMETRKKYYECVMEATDSGYFDSFKSTLQTTARNTAIGCFGLDDKSFIELDDQVFMEWCAIKFGPANKNEAIRNLKTVKIDHRDSQHCQSSFLAKFDSVCYEHEVMVNDIADSVDKWPSDEADIDCAALTLKEIQKEWKEIFARQDHKVFSKQIQKCRTFIEQNQEMPFNVQVQKLRKYFELKDLAVAQGDEEYSTKPYESTKPEKRFRGDENKFRDKTYESKFKKQNYSTGNVAATVAKNVKVKKAVQGHKRGWACGNETNHHGNGCTKEFCFVVGTEFAKPKGYVWKSSDVEPSVHLPNEVFQKQIASRPDVFENNKKARNQAKIARKVAVSALATQKEDQESSNSDRDEDEESSSSDDSNASSVNTDYYHRLSPSSIAKVEAIATSHIISEQSQEGTAEVAALKSATGNDDMVLLGHEQQFFAIARLAKNNALLAKTLMDPGATINVISPAMANRAAVKRKQICVHIFQGTRKQASVEEMALCNFELMEADGAWVPHSEWFAVCELGYEVLLGRRFCRINGFTSFDSKLTEYAMLPPESQPLRVSALEVIEDSWALRFDRAPTPLGKAKYKRSAKSIKALLNQEVASIGKGLLTATNPLSALSVLSSDCVDGKPMVLLSFTIDVADKKRSEKMQEWFYVVDGKNLTLSCNFVSKKCAAAGFDPLVHKKRVSQKEIVPLPRENKKVELSEEAVAAKKKEISEKSRQVQRDNDIRFASYHPIQHYRLKRTAEKPPLSHHWKKDHKNYYAQKDYKGERAVIKAAVAAAEIAHHCRYKERQFRRMVNQLSSTALKEPGLSPSIDYWMDQYKLNTEEEVQLSSIEAINDADDPWKSEFRPGQYIEIEGAVKNAEFNGQRARLYSKTDTSGLWIIRILGKNQGKYLCHERFFKKLSELDQRLSVPTGAQAGFDDVGIDAAGQPNVEIKSVAHRQFGKEYSEQLTKRIEALKAKFPTVFTTDVTEPCNFEPMKIRLIPNAVLPSKARHYRNTPKMREEVRRQIQEQLEWGVIKECITPCVSDVLLVKRPHMPGKFRFCVSYVKLNEATVKEQLVMPDPKSQHERLKDCEIFGALDYASYYRQIRLHKDSQYLTGFASDQGTYCYTRIPMGITGACQYAQKCLQDALAQDPILGPLGIKNYFDDLPFGAKTEDEFMIILEALLNFCVKWKLKVNPEKTVLGVTSITHVGFVISKDGVSIDPERTRDIAELTPPKSIKKVQSILGIFNYVRNFIEGFSAKAKFLTDKLGSEKIQKSTKKGDKQSAGVAALSVTEGTGKKVKVPLKFTWTEDDQRQFEALKKCVLQAPLLAQLDYELPIYIRCDASRFGCGAVLFQYDSRGYEHPVCYASRKFLPAEQNWSTFSQEASTVVWALERFQEYTQGYHTIVECDHRNISYVKKSAMPQLARWRLRLQDMDFSVRYLAGARNITADGLSRQHVDEVEVNMADVIPECALPEASETDSAMFKEIAAMECVAIAEYNVRPMSRKRVAITAEQSEEKLVEADPFDDFMEECVDEQSSSESEASDSEPDEEDNVESRQLNVGEGGIMLHDDGSEMRQPEQQPRHLVLPTSDANTEIALVHNDLVGHAGTYVTLQRALRNGRMWASRKQMLEDVDNYIRGCPCCQKMRKRSSGSLVQRHVISGSPFSELSIDLLKLPHPDAFGNEYVVVIVDHFSHWTTLVAGG